MQQKYFQTTCSERKGTDITSFGILSIQNTKRETSNPVCCLVFVQIYCKEALNFIKIVERAWLLF